MSYEIIANVGRDPSLLIRLNLKTNEYSKKYSNNMQRSVLYYKKTSSEL